MGKQESSRPAQDQVCSSCCKFHELAVAGSALDLPGRLPVSLTSSGWRRVSQTLPWGCSWAWQANLHIWGIGEATFRGSKDGPLPRHGPLVFQGWGTELWDLSRCVQERKQA